MVGVGQKSLLEEGFPAMNEERHGSGGRRSNTPSCCRHRSPRLRWPHPCSPTAHVLQFTPGRAKVSAEKKCPECGYRNEPEATFCGNCGNPLQTPGPSAPPPPSSLPEEITPKKERVAPQRVEAEAGNDVVSSPEECPKCHYPTGSEDVFCRQCGAALVERQLYCPRCRDPVDADERFCSRCGLALR